MMPDSFTDLSRRWRNRYPVSTNPYDKQPRRTAALRCADDLDALIKEWAALLDETILYESGDNELPRMFNSHTDVLGVGKGE